MFQTCTLCGAKRVDKQWGLEEHPQLWVDKMVELCRELHRVLRDDGVMFWNIGETYFNGIAQWAGSKHKENVGDGLYNRLENMNTSQQEKPFKPASDGTWLQPKQLLGLPWRFAIAMQGDVTGWEEAELRDDLSKEQREWIVMELFKRKLL